MKKLDHVLLRVEHLETAMAHFRKMGFKVYPGSTKKNAHHAMIYFKDGSFIELIDPSKFPQLFRFLANTKVLNLLGIAFQRFSKYATSADRYLDYAIYTDHIETFYKKHPKRTVSKLMNMKRKNHLNVIMTWQLFAFKNLSLPFVMSAYTPQKLPDSNASTHSNAIEGISEMNITTSSQNEYRQALMTQFEGIPIDKQRLKIGETQININHADAFKINSITLKAKSFQPMLKNQLAQYNIKLTNES